MKMPSNENAYNVFPVFTLLTFLAIFSLSYYNVLRFEHQKWNLLYDTILPNFTGTQEEFRDILLQEYNYYREMRNLSPYVSDHRLNEIAEKYVDLYLKDPDDYVKEISTPNKNITPAMLITPYLHPKLVALNYYDERKHVDWNDYPKITINSTRRALHFTAMIWKGGRAIGTAFKSSTAIKGARGNHFSAVSVIYFGDTGVNNYDDFPENVVPLHEEIAPYL